MLIHTQNQRSIYSYEETSYPFTIGYNRHRIRGSVWVQNRRKFQQHQGTGFREPEKRSR